MYLSSQSFINIITTILDRCFIVFRPFVWASRYGKPARQISKEQTFLKLKVNVNVSSIRNTHIIVTVYRCSDKYL